MIKKTIKNLIKALELRATTTQVDFNLYDEDEDDIQCSFSDTSVPLVADVRGIVGCFCNNVNEIVHVDNGWGFTEIYLSDGDYHPKQNVNLAELGIYINTEELK